MTVRSRFTVVARTGLVIAVGFYAMNPGHAAPSSSDETAFMEENHAAMSRMMKNMDVNPSGNVDVDFVALMQPHHQAAIEMAESELRYGHNEKLRHVAQEIIAQQQQEIAAMHDAVKESSTAGTVDQPEQGRTEVPHRNPKMDGPPGS
jgi:hypothetical protein